MHNHSFDKKDWPFDFEDDVGVVTTRFVMSGEHPIVEVLHWDDGGWQFMCNTTEDADKDGMVVCIGCLDEKYPFISEFKYLKKGHLAYLDSENELRHSEKIE
jgi:hypothetical protein